MTGDRRPDGRDDLRLESWYFVSGLLVGLSAGLLLGMVLDILRGLK